MEAWIKRPKIILHGNELSKATAHEDLKKPIRSRKSSNNSSPNKILDHKIKLESSTPSKFRNNHKFENYYKESSPTVPINTSFNASALEISKEERLIEAFQDCLFVVSNLPDYSDDLTNIIESSGGEVLDEGFTSLFIFGDRLPFDDTFLKKNFDVSLHLINSKIYFKSHLLGSTKKFACLLASRHLRSLKYLETLALGWPTLHWKFIEELQSLGAGNINEKIWSYLLPSGESLRLYDNATKSSVLLSSNIQKFYTNFRLGKNLDEQLAIRSSILQGWTVLILGNSNLDKFLSFCFSCLGASKIAYLLSENLNRLLTQRKKNPIKRQKTTNTDSIFHALDHILSIKELFEEPKVLLYVNCNNIDNEDYAIETIQSKVLNLKANHNMNISVESKEWLIQTIIHSNSGLTG